MASVVSCSVGKIAKKYAWKYSECVDPFVRLHLLKNCLALHDGDLHAVGLYNGDLHAVGWGEGP